MAPPEIIYGTSFLGINDLDSEEESLRLLEYVWSHGIRTFDTAELYPPLGEAGKSERIIARFIATHPDARVWSKTAVTGDWSGRGNLARDLILSSGRESRARLGVPIDIYFPHTPDPLTPYAESLAAFRELRAQGVYRELGLSNFSLEQTRRFCEAVDVENKKNKEEQGRGGGGKKGEREGEREGKKDAEPSSFPMPVTAQWQYNPLCRHIEKDLIPLYREKGIAFTAYSPLAGGFLTGKVTEGRAEKSRFDPVHFPPGKKLYLDVYDKPCFHEAYRLLKSEAARHGGLTVPNASIRWLLHHSALGEGDGLIFGSTKFSQAEEILEGLRQDNGPLPGELVAAFDRAWDMVKDEHVIRHGMDGVAENEES